MHVVCLKGSPRASGNSSAIADVFCGHARNKGAHVFVWQLNELSAMGCQACYLCKTNRETCAVEDDLSPVLDAVQKAEVLVLATPVYFADISAQLKIFLDRTFSFLKPDFQNASHPGRLDPGKRLIFIQSQGHPDQGRFDDIYPKYSTFLMWQGFRESALVRACGFQEAGEAARDPEILAQVEDAAERMLTF